MFNFACIKGEVNQYLLEILRYHYMKKNLECLLQKIPVFMVFPLEFHIKSNYAKTPEIFRLCQKVEHFSGFRGLRYQPPLYTHYRIFKLR